MLNNVTLIGRLGGDPELKMTLKEKTVTTFRLAVPRTYGEGTDWLSVTAWGKTAEVVCRYLGKGDLIGVEGHLKSSEWKDKEGKTVYDVEVEAELIHFLGKRKVKATSESASDDSADDADIPPQTESEPEEDDDVSEIEKLFRDVAIRKEQSTGGGVG